MSIRIGRIVLYSRSGERREIALRPRGLTVLLDGADRSMAAVPDLVDYILGAQNCPVGDQRVLRSVAWAGLELLGPSRWMLARELPTGPAASGDCAAVPLSCEDAEVADLDTLRAGRISRVGVLALLTQLLGLPTTEAVFPGGPRVRIQPRHAVRLMLQKWSDLTSPHTLMHGQPGFGQRPMRGSLAYFTGAVQAPDLAHLRAIARAQRAVAAATARVAELEAMAGSDGSRPAALLAEARIAGLVVPEAMSPRPADLLQALRGVKDPGFDERPDAWVSQAEITAQELEKLFRHRARLRKTYAQLLEESLAAQRLQADHRSVGAETSAALGRLEPLEMVGDPDLAREWADERARLRQRAAILPGWSASLGAAQARIADRIEDTRRALAEVSRTIAALEPARARNEADAHSTRAVVLGRIALYLEAADELAAEPSSRADLLVRQIDLRDAESRINADVVQARIDHATALVSSELECVLAGATWSYQGEPVRLDLRRLTVVVDRADRAVPMSRFTTVEDVVTAHLAAHLALHRRFAADGRPVPRNLFVDHPGQQGMEMIAAAVEGQDFSAVVMASPEQIGDPAQWDCAVDDQPLVPPEWVA